VVLDIFVQDRRNAAAAKRFFKRLLQGLKYKPRRSSPTACAATVWRIARFCPMSGIERAAISTIRREFASTHPQTRAADAAVQVLGQAQRSLAAHGMTMVTSARVDISWWQMLIVLVARKPSGSGNRRPAPV
jgi:putative transposase